MASLSTGRQDSSTNPIDLLEELVSANEWRFDRTNDGEMVVEIGGNWCDYRMYFSWQEDLAAVYFSCLFDVRIPAQKRPQAIDLVAMINEKLWLGHFDLCSEDLVPMFRHTMLMRGGNTSIEPLEDLVDIALNECDRYFPAFQFVLWGGKSPREALDAAMLDPVGEA
jgi:hypothetical protein